MKIVQIGGNRTGLTGDSVAINNISRILAKTEKIYVLFVLPVCNKGGYFPGDNFFHVEKRLNLTVLCYCIKNLCSWFKFIFPYLKRTFRGYAYYFITLFVRGVIEQQITEINPEIIHIHGVTIDTVPYIEASFRHDIPLVVTLHGLNTLNPHVNLYFNKNLEGDFIRILAKKNAYITAVSSATKQEIVRHFQVNEDQVKVIFNGVEFDRFGKTDKTKAELREFYSVPPGKKVLLSVGTLNERKNHIAVLEALTGMDESTRDRFLYVIIGHGPEKDTLMRFIEEHRLQNTVKFLGPVSGKKLIDFYFLSDIFIHPSTSEGFPLVFLEAMAAGLPVVTFADLEGVNDMYRPFCMDLVPSRSIASVIETVKHASDCNWNSGEIREYARHWDWESVCAEYKKVYREAAAAKRLRQYSAT
jgi:glycosyltransferase involved in cell wall biosynthesis